MRSLVLRAEGLLYHAVSELSRKSEDFARYVCIQVGHRWLHHCGQRERGGWRRRRTRRTTQTRRNRVTSLISSLHDKHPRAHASHFSEVDRMATANLTHRLFLLSHERVTRTPTRSTPDVHKTGSVFSITDETMRRKIH